MMNTIQSARASQELLKLNPAPLIHVFELDATGIGEDTILYFHNGSYARTPISFQGVTYNPMPISVTGFDMSGTGESPKPKMVISNIGGFASILSLSTRDLVGARLTRRRTWKTFLDGEAEAGPIELEPDAFFISRRSKETRTTVEFELGSPVDLDGVRFPVRRVISGYCDFFYRGQGCGWAKTYVTTDNQGLLFDGMDSFKETWSPTETYSAGNTVQYSAGIYKALQTASGPSQSPTNASYWVRKQNYRGEYSSSVSDYAQGDVVYRIIQDVRVFFISIWPSAVPPGLTPPNSLFWKSDVCLKFLTSCRQRFDPQAKGNILNFGGFPGTVNLPTL